MMQGDGIRTDTARRSQGNIMSNVIFSKTEEKKFSFKSTGNFLKNNSLEPWKSRYF